MSQALGATAESGRRGSRFSPRRPFLFPAVFAVTLVLQCVVVGGIFWQSKQILVRGLRSRLQLAASAVDAAVRSTPSGAADMAAAAAVLRRIQESESLDSILVLGRDGRVVLDARGPGGARPLSPFDASPATARGVFDSGRPAEERMALMGDSYVRTYHPLRDSGTTWGVLCVSAYDPVPERLRSVYAGLWTVVGLSVLSASLVGLLVHWMVGLAEDARRKMVRAERLTVVGTLAASIAHDIKTPLGTILSSVQLLRRGGVSPADEAELMSNIEDEARRSSDQVDSFLDLARDVPLRLREDDVGDLVRSTADLFQTRVRHAGLNLERQVPGGRVPARIDRGKLRRALANLIMNAIEAMEKRTDARIQIRVVSGPEPDGSVSITVEDNGPGMTADEIRMAMEPFYTTKTGGTGLGLTLARQVAEQHGGGLHIESTPGRGTSVTLRLPTAGPTETTPREDGGA